MSKSPSIILKSRFLTNGESNNVKFSFNEFLNYMDRYNTKKENNNFNDYQDYMDNDEKTSGLFSNNKDSLSDKDKDKYKDIFKKGQDEGSILWQDVISFDNDWLKEIGVLKNNNIDEKRLMNVTRETVNEMLKNENMLDNSVWTGAIHYNTDNIHIHLATIQTHNFRERGKRKPQTLEKMKSNVANKLVDRSKENQKINDFIRKDLVGTKKKEDTNSIKNRIINKDMVKQFNHIYSLLPSDKSKWKYNMNSMKELRPEIDKLTDMYIKKSFPNEYKEFTKQIDKNFEFYKKTYGNNSKADIYRNNVYTDMYSRMGNTILTEMREFDKKNNQINRNIDSFYSRKKAIQNKIKFRRSINNSVYKVDRYMKDNLQSFKNRKVFEQLERESEFER